jgi:hypothetical protein
VITAVPVVVEVEAILSVRSTPAVGLVALDVDLSVSVPLAAVEPCTVGEVVDVPTVSVVPTVPVLLILKSDEA